MLGGNLDWKIHQDPDDVEEWFGIVKLNSTADWYITEFRTAYHGIKNIW